jgi:hypothetical protein
MRRNELNNKKKLGLSRFSDSIIRVIVVAVVVVVMFAQRRHRLLVVVVFFYIACCDVARAQFFPELDGGYYLNAHNDQFPENKVVIDHIITARTNDAVTVFTREAACNELGYALSVFMRANHAAFYVLTDSGRLLSLQLRYTYYFDSKCRMESGVQVCQSTCGWSGFYDAYDVNGANVYWSTVTALISLQNPCEYVNTEGVTSCSFRLCSSAADCQLAAAWTPTYLCKSTLPDRCLATNVETFANQGWSDSVYIAKRPVVVQSVAYEDTYVCADYIDASTGYATQPSYVRNTGGAASRPCRIGACPPGFTLSTDALPRCVDDIVNQCMRAGATATDYPWLTTQRLFTPLLCGTRAQMCNRLGYWTDFFDTANPIAFDPANPTARYSSTLWRCTCARSIAPYAFLLVNAKASCFTCHDTTCGCYAYLPTVAQLRAIFAWYDTELSLPYRLELQTVNTCPEKPIFAIQGGVPLTFPTGLSPLTPEAVQQGVCVTLSATRLGCTCANQFVPDYQTYAANPLDPMLASPYCTVSPCVDWRGDAATDCYGRGTCDTAAHVCTCTAGWYGRACEWPVTQTLVCGAQTVTLTAANPPAGNVAPEDALYQLAASTLTVNALTYPVEVQSAFRIAYRLTALASPYALWAGLTLAAQRALQLDRAAVCGALAAAASGVCTLPFQALPDVGNAYALCSPPVTVWYADFEAQTIWCMAVSPLVPAVHAAGDTFCWSNYDEHFTQPVACQFFDTYRLAALLASPQHDMYKWSALHAVLDDVAC